MKRVLLTTTAVAALLGGAFAVSAQEKDRGMQSGGGTAQSQPQSGGAQNQSPQRSEQSDKGAQGSDMKSDGKGQRAQSDKGDAKGKTTAQERTQEPKKSTKESQGTARDKSKDTQKQGAASDKSKDAQKQGTASDKSKDTQKQGTASDKSKDTQKQGTASDKSKDTKKQAQDKAPDSKKQDAAKSQQPDTKKQDSAQKGDASQRVQLSQEQRTKANQSFRQQIRQQNVQRVTNVNVSVVVGTRLPHSVRLHAIPTVVLDTAPSLRGFRFVLIEERIVIIDPATYEIVLILDDGVGPAPARDRVAGAHLELTPAQRQFIIQHVETRRTTANVRVGLALGAEVPNAVELIAFPETVVAEIPSLKSYRFVTTESNLVIVDPNQRHVALLIDLK